MVLSIRYVNATSTVDRGGCAEMNADLSANSRQRVAHGDTAATTFVVPGLRYVHSVTKCVRARYSQFTLPDKRDHE